MTYGGIAALIPKPEGIAMALISNPSCLRRKVYRWKPIKSLDSTLICGVPRLNDPFQKPVLHFLK